MAKTNGIHFQVDFDRSNFSTEERVIINKLTKKYWKVTWINKIKLGNSEYHVALLKPGDFINETFNIHREVAVVFSSYEEFMPRAFDVLDELAIQELRLEEICSIIISKDSNVAQRINTILKSNQEARVLVPFTYDELLGNDSDEFVIDRMRKEFFSRDLFGIQNALKKDLYFFGRRGLLQELVNKHESNENCGIFGLRKTGKTSILYGIERTLNRKSSISIFIDCQTIHNKSWNQALKYIVIYSYDVSNTKLDKIKKHLENYDDESLVAETFYDDITNLISHKKKNLLIIFDEIENITFDTSASENWKNGKNFIKFWQVIRSTCQRNTLQYVFTFLIAGTNPRCVEIPTIDKVDNPIFQQFTPIYIEPFTVEQTQEMVERLGGYMGLRFSQEVCTHIVEDFGGHPLLMRQVCSFIHRKLINEPRPLTIKKAEYIAYKQQFYAEQTGFHQYAKMILNVLENWYEDEFQMLKWLAINDIKNFKECAQDPFFITHLLSYGIIESDNTSNGYHFKIEALQTFLEESNKYTKPVLTDSEREKEIQQRRSNIERSLRTLTKRQLKANLGEDKAKEEMIRGIYSNDKRRTEKIKEKSSILYKDLFDPSKHKLYFSVLCEIIERHYDYFKNLFGVNIEVFKSKCTLLNVYRRTEAHSIPISDTDFETFRAIASWFEDKLSEE